MKFRNILLTTFAASAFVIGTTSCSDSFLDEKMYSSYGPEVSDVNAKLVGLHRQYAAIWGMSSQQGFVGCWQVGTDVGAPGDTQGVEVPFYRYQELNAENAGVSFLWEKLYELINSANQIIASQAEGGDAAATAEAMFFRAYAYNMLVTLWGDVPLVTKVLTVDEANSVFRDSKESVIDFVVSELQTAIPDLPVTRRNEDYGRITKGAALAILGRVFLAEKRWKEAKDAYKQVIDLGVYEIDSRFSDLFIEKGENSKEFILVSKRMPDIYSTSIQLSCQGFMWGGYHHFSPYNELVEDFECVDGLPISESPLFDPENPYANRDPRLLKSIFVDNISVFKGMLYIAHPDSNPNIYQDQLLRRPWSGYMVRKFCDEDYDGNLNVYGCDFPMIRYAEVLLSYLEANIEDGSPITQNLLDETINKVRGRAEIKMPPVTELNPNKLTTILRRERRVELAWEGLRLFDLFRWRTAHIILKGRFHGMKVCSKKDAPNYTKVPVNADGYYFCEETFFREDVDYLWPIPQAERDVNKNLTQNNGY